MAIRISKVDFEEKVLHSSFLTIVDFYSDSCGACKRLAPALGELEEILEGKIKVFKVNTNFDKELNEAYGIRSNPTLLLFQSGEVLDRRTGAASVKELETWILPYMK